MKGRQDEVRVRLDEVKCERNVSGGKRFGEGKMS